MRMIAAYHKEPALRYISHLDIQRTLHRAFSRANLPVQYSAGFNPHPQLSFASALSTGMAGCAEWFDVTLYQDVAPEEFMRRLNAALPAGLTSKSSISFFGRGLTTPSFKTDAFGSASFTY